MPATHHSEIRFYEGLQGSGVVASITYGSSRVIFDFGAPFNPMTQPYDGQVERRARAWVNDAIRLGQIPPVDGVFSARDLGAGSRIQPYEESNLTTGVIISHLHLDHMSGIGMVHPDIPVYLHRLGVRLQHCLDAIGEAVGQRPFSPVELHEPFQVGDIRVTAYFSDHPCAGAVGYLIEPPDGKVYYSGDVRLHGGRRAEALADLERVAGANVDVLILDMNAVPAQEPAGGFHPSLELPPGMVTERYVLDQVQAGLQRAPGLAVFNIYHRDLGLIEGLFEAAERAGRRIVFEPKTAYVVMQMLGRRPLVFVPDNPQYGHQAGAWFQEVLAQAAGIVGYADIHAAPAGFLLQNSYENILELFDLPSRGAPYFHLYGIPLVEGAQDYKNMQRVLRLTGMQYDGFANLYCYNHAYPDHLRYITDLIRAKDLVGVHSRHPRNLVCPYSRQVLPEKGRVYQLLDGRLALKDPA